jgi:hypothetical protein
LSTAVAVIDDPAAITVSWLTGVLQGAGVDAVVADASVVPVGTGQMGACYRMDVAYRRGSGPARLIAKLPAADRASRATAAMGYRIEVRFYRELAPSLRIRVPRCYLAALGDDATTFTLVLEDMAPAEQGDQVAGCTPAQARDAAVNAAGLHGPRWCDPTLHDLDWVLRGSREMVEATAGFVREATEAFLRAYELESKASAILSRFADRFVDWVLGRPSPFSLVHNDYRLDNLLFAPPAADAPAVTTVDWQSLTVGLPLRDVAYLVSTGLATEARRAHEREIVAAYHRALASFGIDGYGLGRCWDDYRYALFQGPLISVLGSYVARRTDRGHRMFTVMVERAVAAIEDLGALELLV